MPAAAETLDEARRLAARARAAGADLLVLPQRMLGGACASPDDAEAAAEPSDGEGARTLAAIAREHAIAILCGYVERCSGRRHDATRLFDANGLCVLNYRRAHLRMEAEAALFAHGHWLSQMPLDGSRLGLLLGHDLHFPEAARALALSGADVLVHQARADADGALLTARAIENGVPVVSATGGPDAPAARIIGPAGVLLAQDAELAVAELPRATGGPHADRRPRLYARLVEPHPGVL